MAPGRTAQARGNGARLGPPQGTEPGHGAKPSFIKELTDVSSVSFPISLGADTVTAHIYGAREPLTEAALIMAHGAGAGQHSAFMIAFAEAIAALGIDVVTFNFLYIERQRRVPDKTPVLEACYRAAIDATRRELASARHALFIGGKSMGGRIATQVAAADAGSPIAGLVLLGYPLHPPGRPDKRRDAHLPDVKRPMLFVQGSRDTFGTPEELAPILAPLSPRPEVHVVEGGDHSFKVSRTGKGGQAAVFEQVQQKIASWIGEVAGG
jgi:predicted alpha/beta-hydrolase family hydrolase